MNKGLTFAAGVGVGTGAMFLLDPDRGKRRRALVRDKFVSTTRKTGEAIGVTARDLSNRAHGIASSVQSRFTSDETDDAVLVDRVRSKLGRIVSHPRAIEVATEDGKVTLGIFTAQPCRSRSRRSLDSLATHENEPLIHRQSLHVSSSLDN